VTYFLAAIVRQLQKYATFWESNIGTQKLLTATADKIEKLNHFVRYLLALQALVVVKNEP